MHTPLLPTRRLVLAGATGLLSPPSRPPPALHAFIDRQRAAADIPGLAVGAARDGRVVLAQGYGFAELASRRRVTADTVFHMASVTKTIVATGVMQLVEQGGLSLDAPVAPLVEFPLAHPRHPELPITVRQLLTHTSGISDERYYQVDFRQRGRDVQQSLGAFLQGYLAPSGRFYSAEQCYGDAPGAAWAYSNVGYALLGHVAGRVVGRDFRDELDARLLGPLGMRHARWRLQAGPVASSAIPYDNEGGRLQPIAPVAFPDWPAGMLRASVSDVIRFAAAAANAGGGMLQPSSQAAMLAMTHPTGLPDWLSGQGLGWQQSPLDGRPRPNHWGGDPGVFTVAYLDPERRAAAVVLVNTSASTPVKTAVKAIASRLLQTAAA